MWKRVLIFMLGLWGTFSAVYAYQNIQLQTASFNIGGEVYGQMGSPSIGDRIYLGTKNNLGEPMGWVIMGDYSISDSNTGFVGSDSYLAMSTSVLDYSTFYSNAADVPTYWSKYDMNVTEIWKRYNAFNGRLTQNSQDMKLVAPRNVEWQSAILTNPHIASFLQSGQYGWNVVKSNNIDPSNAALNDQRIISTLHINHYLNPELYGIEWSIGGPVIGKKVAYPEPFQFVGIDALCAQKPVINIDTDHDGRPDLNLDLNHDGVPELNVDTDGDLIPNINIDTTGDGIADTNISRNGDGIIEGQEVIISVWKPTKNYEKDGFYMIQWKN